MKIDIAGENSLILYFGEQASPETSAQIQTVALKLSALMTGQLIDLVPSYASLLVIYDPLKTNHMKVRRDIQTAAESEPQAHTINSRLIELPVYYSEASGPDLQSLASAAKLTPAEVIHLHQQMEYRVYAIGFAPGFAYLGQVDERIAAPRLSTPRQKVPRGAVAIADRQTAVYPSVSPGGWNLIGLCPTRMFDPDAEPPMPISVGDRVRFKPIGRQTFLSLGGQLDNAP